MPDYVMVKKCWTRNKSALTRARNQHDHYRVLDVCEQAFRDFDAYGYPDDWALFRQAAADAAFAVYHYSSDEQNRVNAARVAALF